LSGGIGGESGRGWKLALYRLRSASAESAGHDTMQPYGHVLSDDEIRGVLRYIRETFGKGQKP
jgi:mono/diheme cytochrome c family protein